MADQKVPPQPGDFQNLQGGVYTEFAARGDYEWDYGEVIVPVAGKDGTPAEVVKLHSKTGVRVVSWRAQRIGSKPILPSANTQNPNEILVGKSIGPSLPGLTIDGNQLWSVDGVYRYGMRVPPDESDSLAAGHQPLDRATAANNVIVAGDFSTDIFGTSPGITVNGQKVTVNPPTVQANKLAVALPGVVQNPAFIQIGQ